MGERSSSLLGKLAVKSRRFATGTTASSSASSSRQASSPATTPEFEFTTSFSDPPDYHLGYSSINHERSPSYKGKRVSRAAVSHPIEFDRYAESSPGSRLTTSEASVNKLSAAHVEENSLFVRIEQELAPMRTVQSTVRAQPSWGTLPPHTASSVDAHRPQSPFAITSAALPSRRSTVPSRGATRRCFANHSTSVHESSSKERDPAQAAGTLEQSFYAVARGWKKGVYTMQADAERQIRGFPGPLLQVFHDRAAAENFIANTSRSSPHSPVQGDSDDEFVERTRIFDKLDPNSELSRLRTISMAAERKEAQRRSRIHIAMRSPVLAQEAAALASPPLSLHSIFSAATSPTTPIEEFNGPSNFPASIPLQSMSLLPVKDLARSLAFYAKVLGFTCVSQIPGVQAVMCSASATICLRTADIVPPPPTGLNVSRISITRPSSADVSRHNPRADASEALPTMAETHPDETELWLPPTPESLNLACTGPEPLVLPSHALPLPSATSVLSGATVLIEYSGELEAMHSLLSARLNDWRLARTTPAQTMHANDGPRLLYSVQQTPWDAQELHLCDLDGHRIIYTTPFLRGSPGASLI